MTNKRLVKVLFLVTGFLCIVAASTALVRVRAQIAIIQPFVAFMVEEVAPRKDQPPTPLTRLQTIAVRSDGSICRVSRMEVRLSIRFLYSREVIDATTKAHVGVEDYTRTVVKEKYDDIQVLKPGVPCEGKPAGQIEGFDVMYFEPAQAHDDGIEITHKQWLAPQLGCYPIVQEWIGTIRGMFMDTKQTLASIKFGEPDPWYFKVPPDYTIRTTDESIELIRPLLKQ
jgi:hypothetical protein